MDFMKRFWYLAFPVGYAAIAVVTGIVIAVNDGVRPVIGGLFWPLRLLKILLTGE